MSVAGRKSAVRAAVQLLVGGVVVLVPTVAHADPARTVTDLDRRPTQCVTNEAGTFCYGAFVRFVYVSKGEGEVITGSSRTVVDARFADGFAVSQTYVDQFTVVRDIGGAALYRTYSRDVRSTGGETCTFETRIVSAQETVRVDVNLESCTTA